MTYTNKDLTIKVAVTPMAQAPAKIELLEDGAPGGRERALLLHLDNRPGGRRTAQVQGAGNVDGQTVTSQGITVHHGTVAPTVVQTTSPPPPGRPGLWDPIQSFSEPVKPGTVPSNAIALTRHQHHRPECRLDARREQGRGSTILN